VRREIGRRALGRLILDGRIHPAHIEKIVEDETKAVEKIINEAGEQAAFDANVSGMHPEVLRMMGRLKFRTSYGQNQLAHAVEVSKLAGILAAEIGANVDLSKQGGFLHDIGKAMDHNQEGTHAKLGAEYCRRYGVNPLVVNAIESHHHEVDQQTIEAVIAESADAISGARPGARREDLEAYIKRIRALEDLSLSFEGVGQAFAIQAGREVRVIVKPENIDDLASARLARDIAKKIEESMQYPGQIKVTVIRETRATEFAK
jgi:ribonuclease Y